MSQEIRYRVTLVIVVVLAMAIGGYHRRKAAASGEKISWKEEGYTFAIALRLSGLALWISTAAYLLAPGSVRWAALPLPEWLRWVGAGSGLLGSALMYWTMSSLGKNLTDTVVTRRDATLVTTGPYRWVRHPFYVTAAILMASVTLLTASWLIGVCSLVILTLLAIRTPKEEQMLIARFGEGYREYMRRTGRFWPRVSPRA